MEPVREAHGKSPICRKGEEHFLALRWVLCDPEGRIHETTNLAEFARSNAHLFDPPDERRIVAGFVAVHAWMRGKKGRRVGSYKGWTLLDVTVPCDGYRNPRGPVGWGTD